MEYRGARRALRTTALLGLVAALIPAGPPSDARAAKKANPTVIEGTLIDSKCYSMDRGYTGDHHKTTDGTIEGCAAACAKLGIPTAILTRKGDVAILIAPATELAPYMGGTVRATGTKVFKGAAIRAEKIEVRDADGAWKPVEFHSMM